MRIIDVSDSPIRSVAVSPDSRFVVALGQYSRCAVFRWTTGDRLRLFPTGAHYEQLAFFTRTGDWVAYIRQGVLHVDRLSPITVLAERDEDSVQMTGEFTGGVAVSPDGKKLVAMQISQANRAKLAVWELPSLRPQYGFDDWPPFQRLAFSRNGEYLAGIWGGSRRGWQSTPAVFGIRFAKSGGGDFKYPPMGGPVYDTTGFVSFTHDSSTCAFGWAGEFHLLDLSTGTSRYLRRVEAHFSDAAFTGSGRHFATVDDTGVLKLWDVRTWQVVHEYDWQCGPLTCLTFTADGTAGVCGTRDGRLVQFDVDE
jgi:WD40 repeat protein